LGVRRVGVGRGVGLDWVSLGDWPAVVGAGGWGLLVVLGVGGIGSGLVGCVVGGVGGGAGYGLGGGWPVRGCSLVGGLGVGFPGVVLGWCGLGWVVVRW